MTQHSPHNHQPNITRTQSIQRKANPCKPKTDKQRNSVNSNHCKPHHQAHNQTSPNNHPKAATLKTSLTKPTYQHIANRTFNKQNNKYTTPARPQMQNHRQPQIHDTKQQTLNPHNATLTPHHIKLEQQKQPPKLYQTNLQQSPKPGNNQQ